MLGSRRAHWGTGLVSVPALLYALACGDSLTLDPAAVDGGAEDATTTTTADGGGACDVSKVAADRDNCGRCGRACPVGSACENGVCSLGAISTNNEGLTSLVATEQFLWATEIGKEPATGRVLRYPLQNGAPNEAPTPIASGEHAPYGLALADGQLYWTEFDTGTVRRAPIACAAGCGETVLDLGSDTHVQLIDVHGTDAFLTTVNGAEDKTTVWRLGLNGEASTRLSGELQDVALGLATVDGAPYAVFPSALVQISPTTCAGETPCETQNLASFKGVEPEIGLSADATSLYYTSQVRNAVVRRVIAADASADVLSTTEDPVRAPVVADGWLYWITKGPTGTQIFRQGVAGGCPNTTGACPQLVAKGNLLTPFALAVTSTTIFVSDQGLANKDVVQPGALYYVPLP